MKHWNVNIVINYDIEAETKEEAIEQAEIEFSEDTHPSYDVHVDSS